MGLQSMRLVGEPTINEHHFATFEFGDAHIGLTVFCMAPDGYKCNPSDDHRPHHKGQRYCQVVDSWANVSDEMFSEERNIVFDGDTTRIPIEYYVVGWGDNFDDWIRFKVGHYVWTDDSGKERTITVHDIGAEDAAIEAGG